MANRNQLINIPLNGQLCLNKTKVDIEQFTGWNKINAPIYGGCLSPLNKKQSEVKGEYWDNDGNYYQAKQDGLYKNNELVMEYENTDVEITEITQNENEEILAIRGDAKIVLLKNIKYGETQNATVRFFRTDGAYYDIEYTSNLVTFYIDQNYRLYYINFDNSYYYLNYVCYYNNAFMLKTSRIGISIDTIKNPIIQSYSVGGYVFITVFADSFENKSFKNITKSSSGTEKGFYNFCSLDNNLLTTVEFTNVHRYSRTTPLMAEPSCVVDGGFISLYANTVSVPSNRIVEIPGIYKNFSGRYDEIQCIGNSYIDRVCDSTKLEDIVLTVNKNFFRIVYVYKKANLKKSLLVDGRTSPLSYYNQSFNYFFPNCGSSYTYKNGNNSPASYTKSIFNILINNNLPSNISYKEKIFMDWFRIDPDFHITETYNNELFFKASNGSIYKIKVSTVTPKITTVINERFIITNTLKNYCYDIQTGEIKTPFSDYNGRFSMNNLADSYVVNYNYIVGAAKNPKYELTNDPVCSAIFPALIYYDAQFIGYIELPENVDLFYSEISENTVAEYKGTSLPLPAGSVYLKRNSLFKFNEKLRGSTYPVSTNASMDLNPNSNSKFVQTFNNHDLIINGSTTYALNYYNGRPVLLYSLLSGIENLQNTFVLNTSSYGVSKDKIFNISYNNGIASLGEVVANIKGLQFVGALPLRAIFYSPRNRCLYSFGGDAVLVKFIECSDVSVIYKTWYDTSTQAIYFSTNAGLYIMTEDFIYNMDLRPEEIFFFTDGRFAMNFENDSDSTMFLSYERLDANYKTINIKLESKYYGEGRNLPGVVDCWYIRFFNNGIKEGGTIKVKASALTDTGAVGEEKEIVLLPSSWDKDTDSYYLRFQPHLQKGIGVCLSVDSPFAIMDINCGYTGFDGAAQIGHNNI